MLETFKKINEEKIEMRNPNCFLNLRKKLEFYRFIFAMVTLAEHYAGAVSAMRL